MEFSSNAKGNLGVTLGAIGTGLSLLNGNIGGIIGRSTSANSGDEPVTRHELEMAQAIASRDSELALLKSEQNTEVKISDTYRTIMERVNSDYRAQQDFNTAQMVTNATQTATMACMQNNIAALQSMTKLVIPIDNVCPKPAVATGTTGTN